MAYREHGMWEVLEVLRRAHRGEGTKRIARATGRSRNTVRRYIDGARELGWQRGEAEPDEALASRVAEGLQPGPKEPVRSRDDVLLPQREQIQRWLSDDEKDGRLTLTKCHELLDRRGVRASYSTLRRFAIDHCGYAEYKTTVRVADVAPGELAEVDFGRLGLLRAAPLIERRRAVFALVVTLVFSRYQYVHLSHTQRLGDFIDGLEDAWAFFGGITARLVIDNLKAAVTRADRYDPTFSRVFNEYAHYRGVVIDAAEPAAPTHKPHVERQVPFVRENFFRGEDFFGLAQAQHEAIGWCRERAGMRVHGTTRKRPREVFETVERQALRAVADGRFDTPRWAEIKVHPDHHVRLGNALYSVPTAYVGRVVTARADRSLVRLYCNGQLIKTHPAKAPGERSTDVADYPAEKSSYALRDADAMIRRARACGADVGRFAERLLDGDFPWARLRQAHKLLRLAGRFGTHAIDSACARALSFDLIDVYRVERILTQAVEHSGSPTTPPSSRVLERAPRFLRPAGSFSHPQRKEIDDGD